MQINLKETLKAWVDIQHSGLGSDSYNFYNGYDLYNRNQGYSNFFADDAGGLRLAATPGYEGDRFQLGASLDLGPAVGIFGNITSSKIRWDDYFTDHYWDGSNYRYELRQIRSGLYTDIFEAGVRLNPVLLPVDFYASALTGSFGSDGDDYLQHYDGDLKGLRGKVIFNDKGIVSAYAGLTLLELSGSGDINWYDSGYNNWIQKRITIDQSLSNLSLGAELSFAQYIKLQALAQQTSQSGSAGQSSRDSLATELRLRVDL